LESRGDSDTTNSERHYNTALQQHHYPPSKTIAIRQITTQTNSFLTGKKSPQLVTLSLHHVGRRHIPQIHNIHPKHKSPRKRRYISAIPSSILRPRRKTRMSSPRFAFAVPLTKFQSDNELTVPRSNGSTRALKTSQLAQCSPPFYVNASISSAWSTRKI
jgi:hypothetical protein